MAVVGTDQITIVDLTDGYSVFMSPESYAFPAGITYATVSSITLAISALKGTEAVPVTIGAITHSAGSTELAKFNITKNPATGSSTTPTVTIAVKAATDVSLPGSFDIPVDVGDGIIITKRFVYSLAKTGATGTPGTSPNNVVVGMEGVTIPTTAAGATTSAYNIVIPWGSYAGTARAAGTVAVTGLPTGITAGTNTAATTSADGSLTLAVADGSTLGGTDSGTITLTFTVGSSTFKRYFSWAKALTGTAGANGADAVVVAVTSSNGTYFKTSTVSTTLTARVFKGGVQIPFTNLVATFGTGATIKWYKDGEVTASSTGETVVINGALVADKAVYEARLEV